MSKLISTNPANYEVLGEIEVSSEKEIEAKVRKTKKATIIWKSAGLEERVKLLRIIVKGMARRKGDLALMATKEMGMPISQSKQDVEDAIRYFSWYLDNAHKYLSPEKIFSDEKITHTIYHEPIGVAAVIVPWNYPSSNFVWGVGQNLVVGNTVVFKHSEECPLIGKLLEEIVSGAPLPEGVFSQVYGDGTVGKMLVGLDINLICFTGSTQVGKYLYKVGAEKFIKVILECGGSAPGIVFEDANINKILEAIYFQRFFNCGQSCDALKRLIVHESMFDDLVNKLKNYLEFKKIGDPLDETTDIGPLVAQRQLELLETQVEDAIKNGAKVILGAKRPANLKGAFYEPTILTNIKPKMRVWREEVFGPVLPVVSFKTEEEAIKLANDTQYGLGAYVFTKDKKRAERVAGQIEAGNISINGVSYVEPFSPFGGYKQSGIGREHGKFGLNELTQLKVVAATQ